MAKIEGIRIQNFRCLKDISLGRTSANPDAEPLSPLTVVIGKNGVGKSTLFDAFGFLADTLEYGVEEACAKRGGFEKICSQGQKPMIDFQITYRGNKQSIVYELQIMDAKKRIVVLSESLYSLSHTENINNFFLALFFGKGWVLNDKSNGFDIELSDLKRLNKVALDDFSNWLNGNKHNKYKKQPFNTPSGAELIELTDNRKLAIASLGTLKQHPEISELRQFLESWYLSYFTPNAFREINSRAAQTRFDEDGKNLANVASFMENNYPDKFQSILDSIAEKIPGIDKIKTYRDPINNNLYLLFNDKGFAKPFSQLQMSDGTLKLFAYLLLLADPNPPPFICIEEPENGLYHKLLEVLASEFRRHASEENKTQLFITTHQPYFVDGLNPREVWILEKGEDGFSTIRRASDDELVNNLFEEEMPLGGLWYSGYLDKRAKPCTLKS